MKKSVKLTESDLLRIVKRVLNEQDVESTQVNQTSTDSSSLPDCIEYIKNNAKIPESNRNMVGSSPMIQNVNIEYFIDGGPNNAGISIHSNGRRACWTKLGA